ncbi:MAG: TIGR04282 family arsenosugar biosynthesis glycosyltransferase [Sandaracinaceae bacterium]|nr:TIGR04282 family arsenosugar biosynthesis glycosyltransferase [Sandaracinaceae bacterium]
MSAEPRLPVAVFTRAPRPGRVKTRLIPAVGAEGAAALQRAFLTDTLARLGSVPELEPAVWAASEEDAGELTGSLSLAVRAQPPGDLGERMCAALEEGIGRAGWAAVIGSDAPTLPASLLGAARRALEHAELVLGPAHDGGYYLIAARGRAPRLGPSIRWSTRHALADTLAAARETRVALLAPWYDVDTPEDLRLLAAHLARRPRAAPETARTLDTLRPQF